MATITFPNGAVWDNTLTGDKYSTKATGHGGTKGPALVVGAPSSLKVAFGDLQLDSSYPAGGEDISELWNLFPRALVCIIPGRPSLTTVGTKTASSVSIDYTNKKILVYGEDTTSGIQAEFANASNLSTLGVLKFMAIGY